MQDPACANAFAVRDEGSDRSEDDEKTWSNQTLSSRDGRRQSSHARSLMRACTSAFPIVHRLFPSKVSMPH